MSGQTTRVCLNMSDIFKVSAGLLAKEKKITDIQDRKQGWGGGTNEILGLLLKLSVQK